MITFEMELFMSKSNTNIKYFRGMCVFLVMVMFITLLSGCQPVEPITASEFREIVEDLGYTVTDITDQYTQHNHVLKSLVFQEDDLFVQFLEVDTRENAVGMFNTNRSFVETQQGNMNSSSSINTAQHALYRLRTSTTYYIVRRIDTTVVYAHSSSANANRLDEIIRALGY